VLEESIAQGLAGRRELATQEELLQDVASLTMPGRSFFWEARDPTPGCSLQLKWLGVAFNRAFACHRESAARVAALLVILQASMKAPEWVRCTPEILATPVVLRLPWLTSWEDLQDMLGCIVLGKSCRS